MEDYALGLSDVFRLYCNGGGIRHVGYAPVSAWYDDPLVSSRIPEGSRPDDILPGAKSVMVIGVPIPLTIVETAPSIYYRSLYDVSNNHLDMNAYRISLELMGYGYEALFVPRDGYRGAEGLRNKPESFFSHRHAAYLAGMGAFGWNNMLLTPEYGPRMRFTSIITTAEFEYGEPIKEDLCIRCGRCTRACPASAVAGTDYPAGITKKGDCVELSTDLAKRGISPCGRCIAVCPVGRDPKTVSTDVAIGYIRSI